MFCLIAAEEGIAGAIAANLQKMGSFSGWSFETCTDADNLAGWSGKNVDVLVLSRFLPGADHVKLLSRMRMLFPSSHIVLLVGQATEACRAYVKAANGAGLYNVVTGKLPGDRPYTLIVALTRPKNPELDGYEELSESEDESGKQLPERLDVSLPENGEDASCLEAADASVEVPVARKQSGIAQKRWANKAAAGVVVASTANKGGVGKTTAAIAVATALGRAGVPTAIVDFDLGAPDIATFFKVQGVPGIERLSNLSRVSPAQIDRLLVDVENNLHILPGPMNKTLPRFEGGELAAVLEYLKSKFQVVVCDTPPEPWTRNWRRIADHQDRKSTRLNSSHSDRSRMPSSA